MSPTRPGASSRKRPTRSTPLFRPWVVTGSTTSSTVAVPSLFVCGTSDSSIKCANPYALKTKDYVTGNYTYLKVDCGHSVLGCSNKAETQKVTDAIVAHISAATAAVSGGATVAA